ncbi:hypothetical protein C3F00_017915 [Pseudomonas sp. MWU13-2860]|nr:hypothetical protein C3F00_017915 [Pseudomonas sp. MWU13-2860]
MRRQSNVDQFIEINLELSSAQPEQLRAIELEMGNRFTPALCQCGQLARKIDRQVISETDALAGIEQDMTLLERIAGPCTLILCHIGFKLKFAR